MTPRALRAFLEVARTGSVRGAAERLVVTQPAVTAAIRALERDLGALLVARRGRGIVLTPAGETLRGYAEQVLGLLQESRAAVAGAADPRRGRLRLTAVTTAGEHVLPPLIKGFRSRFPDVEIVLEVGNRQLVWERLGNREADVAVGGRPGHGLEGEPFLPNDLIVVGPAGMQLPREPARPADLAEGTWLLREPGSGTRATAEEFLASRGLSPPTLTIGSNVAIVESVALGLGLTLISADAVRRQVEARIVRPLPVSGTPLSRHWHVVTRAGERPPATASLFLEFLREEAAERKVATARRGRR